MFPHKIFMFLIRFLSHILYPTKILALPLGSFCTNEHSFCKHTVVVLQVSPPSPPVPSPMLSHIPSLPSIRYWFPSFLFLIAILVCYSFSISTTHNPILETKLNFALYYTKWWRRDGKKYMSKFKVVLKTDESFVLKMP